MTNQFATVVLWIENVLGVSLPELGQKKIWSYFKYERLPIFCYKCGVIGHLEDDCSRLKRLVAANNGRSIPLFGPWLKDGSRLENGFALLEVEEIQDINRLEKEDLSSAVGPVGRTRVEQVGMEGVVSQKGDNEFNVAYNDYVGMTHFPSKHVIHVANLFKEKLGPIKFGANREEVGLIGSKSGPSNKLKKPRLIGPRGIPRPSLFGRKPTPLGQCSGAKRKKTSHDTTKIDPFVDESDGLSCLVGVDKSGIKDVFAEESGVNHLEFSNSSEGYIDPNKKSRLLINSLRSNEGSFGFTKEQGGEANGKPQVLMLRWLILLQGARVGRFKEAGRIMPPRTHEGVRVELSRAPGSGVLKLRALVLREDPDVLFLMETKLNSRRMNSIWRSLGFGGASCVEASGSAGGLCLCWKAGVDVLISSAEAGVISGVFSNVLNGPNWTGLFIYGPPVRSDRAVFWEARILEILALNHPWVLVGDLNIISGQIDKFGGRSVEAGEGHHLSELMNVTGGVDLGCTGNFFTWSNGRSLPNLVKERLDRAICDPEWIIQYPKAGVKSLVIKESDHAPVMLDLLFDRERVKAPFRYLDAWSRDASCKVIIKEAWDIVVHGIKSFELVSKLENTRRSLSKWNRTHFGMCKEKLKALNRLLLEVQQRTPSDVNLKLEADIILEMEEVETRQAEIWKQKSRELWYKDGDRNTRFFHAATVIKRKRNFIETITPDGLEWISGRNAVGNYFRDKFISVLSSSSPLLLLQHLIRPLISWECTSDLMVFMPYEIKEVVWSMHP
uniref:CCHC-type domain-containing protein n=1 Tax=Cannabis sativa TaxID=3483 RepID=A0A803Q5F6_CANSA